MVGIKIISVEKSRILEQKANEGGLSYAQMMENAGRLTAQEVLRVVERDGGSPRGARIVVLVGPGNNGGDGLVAAHYLKKMGALASCYIWQREVAADANFQRIEVDGLPVIWAEDDPGFEALRTLLAGADVVVDALLGVGVSRPIEGLLVRILQTTREALAERREPAGLVEPVPLSPATPCPRVVAVDCPTGLDCDSGALDPAALPADLTVTFAYPKAGLLRFPGAEAVGELVVADIGVPPDLAGDVTLELATPAMVCAWLPDRPRSAHKGTFGRALIVAGSVNYVGAAALAGAAAVRVGAGLVTMALPPPIQTAVAAQVPEVTYLLLPHDLGVIASGAVPVLQEKMAGYGALLLGPGLTQEKETVAFVHALLGLHGQERRGRIGFVGSSPGEEPERSSLPSLVIDADGLNALAAAEAGEWWTALPPDTILTPHPGEMARLMADQITISEIQADREGVAQRMAAQWSVVVVLKGAFTVVAAPDGRTVVLPFANPGLATAGTGDVLSGAIVGLRAQGLGAFEAAVSAAYLHGLAGELARADLGDMGLVASDLVPRLPLALRRVRRGPWDRRAPARPIGG
ncbi:MAG: NAD(P)H-hydrate dehydratase [Anaerolineae bacterium]|nr:NAD(P)H-hydrate dehydratase [Anaerolineae bacterium]